MNNKIPNYTVDHGNNLVTRGDWKLWKINLATAIFNSLIDDLNVSVKNFVIHQLHNSISTIFKTPQIKKDFSKSKNLVQGDDWTVICPVTGFPYPTVYWTKDGEDLPVMDNRIHIENSGNKSHIFRNIT
jgi:hypothetical protein